jgi:SAM-dependent methyltransferase
MIGNQRVWAMYSDEEVAALYGVLNPRGASHDFYLGLIMEAQAVLDVGCGTGTLLDGARTTEHTGRLCGIDPDGAMLHYYCPCLEALTGDHAESGLPMGVTLFRRPVPCPY